MSSQGTDVTFLQKLNNVHASNKAFLQPKHAHAARFGIVHFAGEVHYQAEGGCCAPTPRPPDRRPRGPGPLAELATDRARFVLSEVCVLLGVAFTELWDCCHSQERVQHSGLALWGHRSLLWPMVGPWCVALTAMAVTREGLRGVASLLSMVPLGVHPGRDDGRSPDQPWTE